MTIDQQLEQLSRLRYPKQVDVVDRVMAQVADRPYLQPVAHRRQIWKPVSIAAVAAVAVLLLVNVVSIYGRSYDEAGMGVTIAQLNDYSSWNTIEEAAVNPYECLYEE